MNRELVLTITISLLFSSLAFAQPNTSGAPSGAPIGKGVEIIEEEDGSPSVPPYKVKVPNNSLTDNGDGTASLDFSSEAQVVTVAKSGGDYTTVQGALDAITDAATGKRYLIDIKAGTYDEQVTGKEYVYFQGAGKDCTIITNSSATFTMANNSGMSHLTIEHTGTDEALIIGTGTVDDVYVDDVELLATTGTGWKLYAVGTLWTSMFRDISIVASKYGIFKENFGNWQLFNPSIKLVGQGSGHDHEGIYIDDGGRLMVHGGRIFSVWDDAEKITGAGDDVYGVHFGTGVTSGRLHLHDVDIMVRNEDNANVYAIFSETNTADQPIRVFGGRMQAEAPNGTDVVFKTANNGAIQLYGPMERVYTGGTLISGSNITGNVSNVSGDFEIITTDTSDPTLTFQTLNTAHEIDIFLDESATADIIRMIGQTASVDTSLQLRAQDGEEAQLVLSSGLTNSGKLTFNAFDNLSLLNETENKDIIFSTNNGSSVEMMRIDGSASRIGIGLTAPATVVDVSGSVTLRSKSTSVNQIKTINNLSNDSFYIYEEADSDIYMNMKDKNQIARVFLDTEGDSYLTGGSVGIGTSSPDTIFQVVGTNKFGEDTTNYTEFESDGAPIFVGTAGLPFAEIYANDVTDELTITVAGQANKVQITSFAVDGVSNNMTPDHTNDHITVTKAGMYLCNVSMSISSAAAGGADDIGFAVYKNNGATEFPNCHGHRTLGGGGTDRGSCSMSGIIDLAVNDTIEVWVWNEDSTDNIVVDDITLSLVQTGGT